MSNRNSRQIGKAILLETEHPKSRAFSRFVLPFRWRAEAWKPESPDSLHFVKTPQDSLPDFNRRRKYFTHETGKVLYERARWLELNGRSGSEDDGKFVHCWDDSRWAQGVPMTLPDGATVTVTMERPRMVLFEWVSKKEEQSVLNTGFLLLDLYFKPRDKEGNASCSERDPILDDLLALNEFFRYIDCPYSDHYRNEDGGYCFRSLLGDMPVSFIGHNTKTIAEETDPLTAYFDRWAELLQLPARIDGDYYQLVTQKDGEEAKNYLAGDGSDPGFLIYADNRTYVWSAASLRNGMQGLQSLAKSPSTNAHDYGHWIKLLNVDMPDASPTKTGATPDPFERDWADHRTYKRWETLGTWYGFSYHSGVMLTSSTIKNAAGHSKPNVVVGHFNYLYFDSAILLFYLRVTLFRFSNELTELAGEDLVRHYEEFKKLREQFAEFTIFYQFPLLSNQQQAIEMYERARKHFDIEDFYNEIKSEIHETHQFLEMVDSKRLSLAANKLAVWGIPLAAVGLSAGILSMMTAELSTDTLRIWDCVSNGWFGDCTVRNDAWVLLAVTVLLAVVLFIGLRILIALGRGVRRCFGEPIWNHLAQALRPLAARWNMTCGWLRRKLRVSNKRGKHEP